MSVKNRRSGFRFERWRLAKAREQGGYGFRAYASKGVVDLVYVDKEGIAHLEQLKFSRVGKPRISRKELADLQAFADRFKGCPCYVSLVTKQAFKPVEVVRLNV